MKVYKTTKGILIENNNAYCLINQDWDTFINRDNLYDHLVQLFPKEKSITAEDAKQLCENYLLPPIGQQEVWAAGVTYLKSRDARMEESKESGGADCRRRANPSRRVGRLGRVGARRRPLRSPMSGHCGFGHEGLRVRACRPPA